MSVSVWQQIDALKSKFQDDMRRVESAAKSYKFTGVKALPHGAWIARSTKQAKHSVSLSEPTAEGLITAMRRASEARK